MRFLVFLSFALGAGLLHGASYLPVSELDEVREASGVFVGKVLGCEVVELEGALYTRWQFEVEEVLKGTFVSAVVVRHRGGVMGERVEWEGDAPAFEVGERYLLFVGEGEGGEARLCLGGRSVRLLGCLESTLCLRRFRELVHGGDGGVFGRVRFPMGEATVFRQEYATVTGSGLNEFRIPADQPARPIRFTRADLGEPIPYVVDKDTLPSGLTEDEALGALARGLAAWSEATGVMFVSKGFASFGQTAGDASSSEQELRIQLHDLYDRITNESTLGIGGASATNAGLPEGGSGGRVYSTEYHRATSGYLVLDHTKASMSDLPTFEEVLCHELGHALGLAHSSESETEVDAEKRDAMMYFRTHRDGRGASVRAWDRATIQKSFPPGNLPPSGANGYLDVVTTDGGALKEPQVNTVIVEALDRDTAREDLTFSLIEPTSSMNGSFSLVGNEVSFTASGFFDVSFIYPLDGNGFYDRATLRVDDGIHGSPPFSVRVLSLRADSDSNGLPNGWVATHFGGTDPDPRGDADGDGLTNVAEYMQRTDPQDAGETLGIGFESSSISVSEGTVVVVPVRATGEVPFRTLVTSVSGDGVARAGYDYSLAVDRVRVPAGQSVGRLVLQVLADDEAEPDETVTLRLGEVSSGLAKLGQTTLEVTIEGSGEALREVAMIRDIAIDSTGMLRFAWRGEIGETYVLERSADLQTWEILGNLEATGAWANAVADLGSAYYLRLR